MQCPFPQKAQLLPAAHEKWKRRAVFTCGNSSAASWGPFSWPGMAQPLPAAPSKPILRPCGHCFLLPPCCEQGRSHAVPLLCSVHHHVWRGAVPRRQRSVPGELLCHRATAAPPALEDQYLHLVMLIAFYLTLLILSLSLLV